MILTQIAQMLIEFRNRYPQGSLVSKLVLIEHGKYIVKVSVKVDNIVLATGLAGADTIEIAEDRARERALAILLLDNTESPISVSPTTVVKEASPLPLINTVEAESSSISLEQNIDKTHVQLESSIISKNSSQPVRNNTSQRDLLNSEQEQNQSLSPVKELSWHTETEHLGLAANLPEEPAILSSRETVSLSEPETNYADESLSSNSLTSTLTETQEIDFNEIKNKTDVEIKRLGWTKDQGRDFLLQTYGKRSRLHLTDEELLDFLNYLESQPDP
jgi:hypothetical protein